MSQIQLGEWPIQDKLFPISIPRSKERLGKVAIHFHAVRKDSFREPFPQRFTKESFFIGIPHRHRFESKVCNISAHPFSKPLPRFTQESFYELPPDKVWNDKICAAFPLQTVSKPFLPGLHRKAFLKELLARQGLNDRVLRSIPLTVLKPFAEVYMGKLF
ncbi:hypothetical protein AVEN_137685-1 [Araneus ventricosus]|uniref:Uncharacterized protein n=1 Tax=Araneus ventricosus TaxID=182803 RepID=A0A4Y2TP47_ARAVE|nr:hypothetical protein AVEN_137685-1 [Araneus ventricosus]